MHNAHLVARGQANFVAASNFDELQDLRLSFVPFAVVHMETAANIAETFRTEEHLGWLLPNQEVVPQDDSLSVSYSYYFFCSG